MDIIWNGSSDLANKLFGENYGSDWMYVKDSSDIIVNNMIVKVGKEIVLGKRKINMGMTAIEELIIKLQEKIKACGDKTKESRARKGAYVDCILMLKEQKQ